MLTCVALKGKLRPDPNANDHCWSIGNHNTVEKVQLLSTDWTTLQSGCECNSDPLLSEKHFPKLPKKTW